MRLELYADSPDVLKWSVVTRAAGVNSRSIRWIVMLREDIDEHGDNDEPVEDASPVVAAFFEQERARIEQGHHPDLNRTALLCQQLRIPIDMNLAPYPTALNTREGYIQNEVTFLNARPSGRRDVVFADPDNGIGESKSNGKQLHQDHVPLIWNALRSGDTLAVVQFGWHETAWVQRRRAVLADLLGLQPPNIAAHPWNNLVVFTIDR